MHMAKNHNGQILVLLGTIQSHQNCLDKGKYYWSTQKYGMSKRMRRRKRGVFYAPQQPYTREFLNPKWNWPPIGERMEKENKKGKIIVQL